MKKLIQSLKGTRDFYPEDMATRTWLYSKVRKVSETFGYQEYEGPFLEAIDLYAAKSGEELVKEQSFVFPDRGGELITLRPELTPTLARMVSQRQKQLVFPLHWWSFGPFWRYERPQKGRSREFFQWNIDLIGVNTPEADAELIAVIASFFKEVSLSTSQVKIGINDRRLVETELDKLDITKDKRPLVFKLIDHKAKMNSAEWEDYTKNLGLDSRQFDGIQKMLSTDDLWKKSGNLVQVFSALEAMGAGDYARYDPNIIRGLDYYTGTVFEAQEAVGDIRRSILGGGRYDNLLEAVGGEPLPAVGFAMGDVVITLILKNQGILPADLGATSAQVLITLFDETCSRVSLAIFSDLRNAGINALLYPQVGNLSKQFKYADRMGIPLALVVGPDELENFQVTLKDLKSGAQQFVNRTNLVPALLERLKS